MSMDKKIENLAEEILQEYTNCYSEVDKEVLAKMISAAIPSKPSEWISVEDELPEICATYLVVVKCKCAWETEWEIHVDVAFLTEDEKWETFNDWNEGNEVVISHWMPLPKAPKMKGGE